MCRNSTNEDLNELRSILIVNAHGSTILKRANSTSPRRSLRVTAFIGVAIASILGVLVPISSASADSISSEKAQAAAIASRINQLNNQVNVLAEQYNQATLKLSGIQAQISSTQKSISAQQKKVDQLKAKLANEAITAYTQAGTASGLMSILQGSSTDVSVRQVLLNTVSFSQQDLISAFQSAKEKLQSQQSQLSSEEAQANTTVQQISSAKNAAQAATSQEQLQLTQVNGTIAVLVRQQQQAQAAAAAAAAKRILEQQLLQQQQRQQQAQQQQSQTQQGQPQSGLGATPTLFQPTSVVPPSNAASVALQWARNELGKPYVFGAAGPNAFDCSGLMTYIFAKAGVSLPHSAAAQYDVTQRVSYSQLQPGDLVFYYQPIDHVGIYIGGGDIIVADNPSVPVRIDSLYWDGVPVGFGRVG